jgi:type IV pilus assembly protein PilA
MSRKPTSGFSRREILVGLTLATGILAAVGYYAYQKSQTHSQDVTVGCVIRQLSAAADQYYLENGVSTARLDQLIGATNYIKALETVAGETYPARYTQGVAITVTGVGGARTVTYVP